MLELFPHFKCFVKILKLDVKKIPFIMSKCVKEAKISIITKQISRLELIFQSKKKSYFKHKKRKIT